MLPVGFSRTWKRSKFEHPKCSQSRQWWNFGRSCKKKSGLTGWPWTPWFHTVAQGMEQPGLVKRHLRKYLGVLACRQDFWCAGRESVGFTLPRHHAVAEVSDAFERGLLVENIKDKKVSNKWNMELLEDVFSVFLIENCWWEGGCCYQRVRKLEWWYQGCFHFSNFGKLIEFADPQKVFFLLPWSDEWSTNGGLTRKEAAGCGQNLNVIFGIRYFFQYLR